MRCYHGTTADHLESILKNGLICSSSKVWSVSQDAVYCYSKNLLKDLQDNGGVFDGERDNVEDWHDEFIQHAFDSASCSLVKAKDCRAVVVVFDVDENELENDDSCPNMDTANCIYRDIKPEEIKEIYISNDFKIMQGYFMSLMYNHPLINFYPSHIEIKIMEAFSNSELYSEDIYDILEWESVDLGVLN